ncbi:MAG TPA: low affinity iron permease family protein [Pseudolabrys sp.]|jgi:low affinity Fe/Cu permease|nr:low affinity iron permease family protein [Pseudolabrys sp.]
MGQRDTTPRKATKRKQPGSNVRSWLYETFSRFAQITAHFTGHPLCFLLAVIVVVVWGVTGPMFGFSDTWQLVINTGTTIVTFLMVFLIQNTQNRDTLSLQLKLSEIVLSMKEAENKFAALEDMSDEELQKLHDECRRRAELTLGHIEQRQSPKQKAKSAAQRSKSHKVQS